MPSSGKKNYCPCSIHAGRSDLFTCSSDDCGVETRENQKAEGKRKKSMDFAKRNRHDNFHVRQLELNNADLEHQNIQLAHKFASAQEKIEDMRRKLGKASSASSGQVYGTSARRGDTNIAAKDELRELLLRRLRGDERGSSASGDEEEVMEEEMSGEKPARGAIKNDYGVKGDNDNMENVKEGWDDKLKSLQREKSQLEKALLERDAELAALRQKENSLSAGCDKLRSELESTTTMLNESRGSLEQMTRTQGALKESLGSTQKTSESIVVKLQEAESNWRHLEQTKVKIDDELNSTQAQKQDLIHQIAYLEEKVLSDDTEKNKLSEQNQKLETQCSQMDAIHQALRQQLATMDSMCSSLQKKKQTIKGDLKDQLNDLYRRIDVLSSEKTSLLLKNESTNSQFDETQKLLTAIRIEQNDLQNAVKEKDAKLGHLEKKVTKLTEARDNEKRARKEADHHLNSTRQENQNLMSELDRVREQLSATQASASRHEAEALRWASTAEQLKTQLETRDAREKWAESKVAELEKKFKKSEDDMLEEVAKGKAMQHRIRSVEGENEWLKGMLRIVKQSAMAGGLAGGADPISRLDAGVRKAGVGAANQESITPSESRDASKADAARRKGSPVGRAMRDSSV